MKNTLKSFTTSSNASASVVDGKLILSLPDAFTPVVWQMDFSSVKASALEVRETKDGKFTLTLKTPKGEAVDVASFTSREQAVSAMMAAAKALENAQGRIRPLTPGETPADAVYGAAPAQPQKPASLGKWLGTIAALLVLIILVGVWGSLAPRPPSMMSDTGTDTGNATVTNSAAPPEGEAGVPLSADEFLKQK